MVADDTSKSTGAGPFDVRTVKSLASLMSQHDLSEIDLRDGSQRLLIRRGPGGALVAAPQMVPQVAMPAAMPAPSQPAAPSAKPESAASEGKKLIEIKSPTPGTFYAASSPDAQAFVRTGSKVTPSSVVCLIEAMKIFNEITADCNGVIAEILVENQAAVEYGQVLFRVDPTG